MILTCVISKNAIAITANLSDILQGSTLEWNHAIHEIEMSKKLIATFKSEESITSLLNEANQISDKCSVTSNITSHVYSIRSHFQASTIDVTGYSKEFAAKVAKQNELNCC